MAQLEPTTDNGLSKPSGVDTFQIRSVSQTRLIRQLGQLSEPEMQLVSQALATALSL